MRRTQVKMMKIIIQDSQDKILVVNCLFDQFEMTIYLALSHDTQYAHVLHTVNDILQKLLNIQYVPIKMHPNSECFHSFLNIISSSYERKICGVLFRIIRCT